MVKMGKTIDITRALAINGFMDPQELVWLAQQAAEHRCIVEIGSLLGRSTRAMLDHTDGIVYAFDDWKGPRDVYMSKEDRLSLFNKFLDNVAEHIPTDKLHAIKGDFATVYDCIPYKISPDMVFLDGSHEYEDVKRDLLFWKDKLVPGGLLCGHDADWVGVASAVNEVLGDSVEIADGTRIWYTVS